MTAAILRTAKSLSAAGRRTHIFFYALLLLFLPLLLEAGEIFSSTILTDPYKIYVNQPFEIFIDVELTQGENIENISIQGFPSDPSYITLGQLEQEQSRRTRKDESGQMIDILRFRANARCHKSLSMQFNPILSCSVVQRRSRSFFSFSSSSPERIRMKPFRLVIHELPQTEMPENFSGAVGKFTLTGSLSKTRVRPGDIITCKLDLNGKGWLNNCAMPSPAVSKEFKSYPPKETLRQDNRITTEQIFIPVSTNAVELAAAQFSYFNPEKERYEECASPTFRLEFLSGKSNTLTNQVKVISTDLDSMPEHTPAVSINIHEVNAAFHQILPAVVGCIFILAASFIFLVMRKINKWVATASLIITLGSGTWLAFRSARYQPAEQSRLREQTTVYLAPSDKSPVIMKLQPETPVTPLETTERWIRIEFSNQRGWIQRDNLAE